MRRLLYGLLAAFAVIGTALAAQNIRQNSDGTASWNSSRGYNNPLGAAYLQLLIPQTNVAATWVLISPISDAKITDVWVTRSGGPPSTRNLITISTACTTGCKTVNASPIRIRSTHGVTDAIINIGPLATVTSYSITQADTLPSGRFEFNGPIHKGGLIFVNTDGGGTTSMSAHVIITVQPQ